MRLNKGRHTMHQVDAVPSERIADDVYFALHHAPDVAEEMWHSGTRARDIGIYLHLVKLGLDGQTAHRLAKGLRGNGPGFDADATDTLLFFDHDSFFPQLRGLNRGPLSGWATANANEIVCVASWHFPSSQCVEAITLRWSRVKTSVYYMTRYTPINVVALQRFSNVKFGGSAG